MRAYEFSKPLTEENEIDDRIAFITKKMRENPAIIQQIYRIAKQASADSEGNDLRTLLDPKKTAPETDQKGLLSDFISALTNTSGDQNDLEMFITNYGKVGYIDIRELMADGESTWDQWLTDGDKVNKVNKAFIHGLFINLFNLTRKAGGSNRGPGEIGLALLSPDITFAGSGDLIISTSEGDVNVEVKGENSRGGGRLKNGIDDFGTPDLEKIYREFDIPEEDRPPRLPSGAPGSKDRFYKNIAERLEEISKGCGTAYIQELFKKTFKHADPTLIAQMIKGWTGDATEVANLGYDIAYSNYVRVIAGKEFDTFLLLKRSGEKSLTFKASEYKKHLGSFKMQSLDFADSQHGPAIQVSMR